MDIYIEELKKFTDQLLNIIKENKMTEIYVSVFISGVLLPYKINELSNTLTNKNSDYKAIPSGVVNNCKLYVNGYLKYNDLNIYDKNEKIIGTLEVNIDLL